MLTADCGARRDYKLLYVGTTQREPDLWAFEDAAADLGGDGALQVHWLTNTDLSVSCYGCSEDEVRIYRRRVDDVTVHPAWNKR